MVLVMKGGCICLEDIFVVVDVTLWPVLHHSFRREKFFILQLTYSSSIESCDAGLEKWLSYSLVSRPFHCPVCDSYCKWSKTGWWECLGTSYCFSLWWSIVLSLLGLFHGHPSSVHYSNGQLLEAVKTREMVLPRQGHSFSGVGVWSDCHVHWHWSCHCAGESHETLTSCLARQETCTRCCITCRKLL